MLYRPFHKNRQFCKFIANTCNEKSLKKTHTKKTTHTQKQTNKSQNFRELSLTQYSGIFAWFLFICSNLIKCQLFRFFSGEIKIEKIYYIHLFNMINRITLIVGLVRFNRAYDIPKMSV